MTYDACEDCKEEKTGGQRRYARCRSCSSRLINTGYTHSSETRAKMSIAWKGKPKSLEHCRNMSLTQGGDGDILNRRYPGLQRWTRLVKERDGHKCAECGYQGTKGKRDVDAHHIIHKAAHPELATVLFNGVTLCKPCHKDIHAT
jgi:hypothetical protein